MKRSHKKVRLGILGCGAIGSGIAKSTLTDLKQSYRLTGLLDKDPQKALDLQKAVHSRNLVKKDIHALVRSCDLMVEAVDSPWTKSLIRTALEAKKTVLAMSVGKLLHARELFTLAQRQGVSILIPSGAIAGIDAIKSASLTRLSKILLTTRKPLKGLQNTPYLKHKGVKLSAIRKETVVFEGPVAKAVKHFPRNINVAATLALATGLNKRLKVRLMTSPAYRSNSHEIEVIGEFGRLITRTENTISPDNPKTSYLAVLSGVQTLKDFCSGVKVGT